MSRGSKAKAKGTAEERRQRGKAQMFGFHTRRLAEEGIHDIGDFTIELPDGTDLVVESKNNAALNIHATVLKAEQKAKRQLSAVWWKRTERKEGAKRRTLVGKPIVCMTEDQWLHLLWLLKERTEGR